MSRRKPTWRRTAARGPGAALLLALAAAWACETPISSPPAPDPGPLASSAFLAIPLPLMTPADSYQGQDGGLYGGGSSVAPPDHHARGLATGAAVGTREGRLPVLMGLGMSNAALEFEVFKRRWTRVGKYYVNEGGRVVVVNGAQGGKPATEWLLTGAYNRLDRELANVKLTPADVQVVWLKLANNEKKRVTRYLPDPQADAWDLAATCLAVVDSLARRYPNLRQVYLSPRTYAGNSRTGEPHAYENAFGVRRCIQDYRGPLFVSWGPYLWDPNAPLSYFDERDGKHPSAAGQAHVADVLTDFFRTSPYTTWW